MKRLHYFIIIVLFLPVFSKISAQSTIYVSATATGNNSGTSWTNAFTNLHDGLNAAQPGDSVWVAQGIYFPTTGTDRTIHFTHKSGTKVFGGFAGTEQSILERQWTTNPTILSGDIGVKEDSLDNSYCVLFMPYPEVGTILDGFIIEKGLANQNNGGLPGLTGAGLGILSDAGNSFPIIRNCSFRKNTALGGGAVNISTLGLQNPGVIAPQFIDCVFENNTAGLGGGISIVGNSDTAIHHQKEFVRCKFYNNRNPNESGGAVYFYGDNFDKLEFEQCEFIGNTTKRLGAGIFIVAINDAGGDVEVKNCIFENNTAQLGAGIYIKDEGSKFKNIRIDSCVFEQNKCVADGPTVPVYGSALIAELLEDEGDINISNSRFLNNSGYFAVGAYTLISGSVKFSGNILENDLTGSEFVSSDSVIISNNVIRNCSRLITIGVPKNSKKALISQNLITNSFINPRFFFKAGIFESNIIANNVFQNDLNYSTDTALVFSNNIFWNNQNKDATPGLVWKIPIGNLKSKFDHNIFDFDAGAALPANWQLGEGNLFNTNPLFVDTLSGNFHIQSCSPAVNAGTAQWSSSFGITQDFDGQDRVADSVQDIGPFEVHNLQLANSPVVTPACAGGSNGAVAFNLINGCLPYDIIWSNENTQGAGNTNLTTGNYSFTITDQTGATLVIPATVSTAVAPVLTPAITDASCANCNDGSISVQIQGEPNQFGYLWNTGESTLSLQQLMPGTYTLTITDPTGCSFSTTYVVDIAVGTVDGNVQQQIRIWPNPVSESFYWQNQTGRSVILQIFDVNGTKIQETSVEGRVMTGHLLPGVYFIVVTSADRTFRENKKLIVINGTN